MASTPSLPPPSEDAVEKETIFDVSAAHPDDDADEASALPVSSSTTDFDIAEKECTVNGQGEETARLAEIWVPDTDVEEAQIEEEPAHVVDLVSEDDRIEAVEDEACAAGGDDHKNVEDTPCAPVATLSGEITAQLTEAEEIVTGEEEPELMDDVIHQATEDNDTEMQEASAVSSAVCGMDTTPDITMMIECSATPEAVIVQAMDGLKEVETEPSPLDVPDMKEDISMQEDHILSVLEREPETFHDEEMGGLDLPQPGIALPDAPVTKEDVPMEKDVPMEEDIKLAAPASAPEAAKVLEPKALVNLPDQMIKKRKHRSRKAAEAETKAIAAIIKKYQFRAPPPPRGIKRKLHIDHYSVDAYRERGTEELLKRNRRQANGDRIPLQIIAGTYRILTEELMERIMTMFLTLKGALLTQPLAPPAYIHKYCAQYQEAWCHGQMRAPYTCTEAHELLLGYITMLVPPATLNKAFTEGTRSFVAMQISAEASRMERLQPDGFPSNHLPRALPHVLIHDPKFQNQRYSRAYAGKLFARILEKENLVIYAMRKAGMMDGQAAYGWAEYLGAGKGQRSSFLRAAEKEPWVLTHHDQRQYQEMERWEAGEVRDFQGLQKFFWAWFQHYAEIALGQSGQFPSEESYKMAWLGIKKQFGVDVDTWIARLAGDSQSMKLKKAPKRKLEDDDERDLKDGGPARKRLDLNSKRLFNAD